jgi:DivIVA domain-containing protein
VDGETDEMTEPTTALPEPGPAPEPEVRITPEQLRAYLSKASFGHTLGRKGYHQGEVDALLARLSDAVAEGEPLADLVRRHRFTHVRLEDGYETGQVDDFLAAVVDLDPNATAATPEPPRNGLLTRLFGS